MVEINPHDLLKIDSISALSEELPSWANSIFPNSLTVVVRRSPMRAGRIPVGVRGMKREHRFATYVDPKDVLKVTTPYELVERKAWKKTIPERQILPAIKALPKLMKFYIIIIGESVAVLVLNWQLVLVQLK
ncbi:phosphoribosyl-dephospho-CoA transferase MdcG domain-containing protein [Companilactobacillus paralimentarius]|uniref:phosphoribosyl-dephospho-CoA transferase MdcG domain-containing protein n=1 Tax=Companilactobacillus paralimentarius TaxID=83526 RepID=UPI00221FCDBA|nr:phosphoribosyl-dephospho-CoA transferase MdcG domain-containing protein [Companilactobacillus paralimentarius]